MCLELARLRITSLPDRFERLGATLRWSVRLASALALAIIDAGGAGAQDRSQEAWKGVSSCTDVVEVEMFILEFPESRFVEMAQTCLGHPFGFQN